MIFIDVRAPDETNVSIPLSRLETKISSRTAHGERIVLTCESGARSRAGALLLEALGYEDICALSLESFEGECIEYDRD